MSQSYKNVYFKDCPRAASGRSSHTLAFGVGDRDIFEAVRHLSSDTLRNALGYQSFQVLQADARAEDRTLNAFCLSILRKRLENNHPNVAYLPGFEVENPIALDPIMATFNGGRHEPLHEWYPYLEGYSPAFVESVIGNYCPSAKSVYDPFGGTGTTPLTASRLRKRAFYSEINPMLQFLTESKLVALQLTDKERKTISIKLLALKDELKSQLEKTQPDAQLRQTYVTTFGESEFFESNVFEDVLRFRVLIDEIGCTELLVARFLTIAVLRSLIPASRLIRRGDIRFKTYKELSRGCVDLCDEIRESLKMIANDIMTLTPIDEPPLLILENAKHLDRVPLLNIDAAITSPPYLNGTNYFRNTKVELWFLRCLSKRNDLSRFRFASMTVGINDVTVSKPIGKMPSCVPTVLNELKANAYDSRIPRMVACYASEMHAVLRALANHTKKNGTIVIDIGDSAYAGVHVPTDQFITESLETAGFNLNEDRVLRQRYSRSQMKLTQRLLVFKPKPNNRRNSRRYIRRTSDWSAAWANFKEALPHQKGEFAKRNWGHPLHSLCSYQGKMKPSLAAHLVKVFATPGGRILDPFSGVGTIPFEAALYGVKSWGFDISLPAVHITTGKIEKWDSLECSNTVNNLEDYLQSNEVRTQDIASAEGIRFNKALTLYFHKKTLNEVLLSRRYFLENTPKNASESLVYSCLLHILHGNRPYALSRRSHPITPFAPTGVSEYRPLIPEASGQT